MAVEAASLQEDPGADEFGPAENPSSLSDSATAEPCAHCTTSPALLLCLGCHQAWYCSLACQKDAWCALALVFC